ncbi:type VI secretion system tip protein VgrG [Agrobacterium tumefaciens]|nr:type VI secretion system tip protein VgrG [Agrobacterium tumefaciens]NTE21021.1 type VI secretion system tip protein VgrG [Agrobacterium tumefaciens]
MAATDIITSGGIATYSIKMDGTPIPDIFRVYSFTIDKKINQIATARMVIQDGMADTGTFDASSSETFKPGGKITIEAGYDETTQLIFSGIITGQSIRIDEMVGSALEVECRDAAIKMIVGRKSLTYSQQKDSDIIQQIIGNYSDLTADVSATTTVWPEQVQYYVTDWDFILARAEINGLVVNSINGKVSVQDPAATPTPVLTISYGDNLMAFHADLNAVSQLAAVEASTWDYKNQVISSQQAENRVDGPGNITSKQLAQVIGLENYQLQTTAPLETTDLTGWCKAQLTKSEYSKIQGTAKIQGTSLTEPGTYVTLAGLGDRFNGNHLVSGVMHDFSNGNWVTEVTIGLPPTWFIEEPDVMAQPASGLIPGARGLFNGTVKKMFEDPDTQYRILVNVPLFDANGAGIWARLSNFYSTNGAGAFFMPEVGDEVILGFLNEDPRYPVILGSLYSSTKNIPFTGLSPNEKNTTKAIVSKSGIYLQFDDDKKVFTIDTPGKNTIVLSDDAQKITITDQNKNTVTMSSDGIVMQSPFNISIQADQTVTIQGKTGVKVLAPGGDVEISGINIKETADSQYSCEGGEMAKINSGMELALKSAMIMIN